MENGEVICEKVYASPRPPPKISLKHDWMKELGSEVARQPDGQVVQQFESSQLNQPNPNPDHDRTEKPVICRDTSHEPGASQTRSSHESTNFNVGDEANHDRTVRPVELPERPLLEQTTLECANQNPSDLCTKVPENEPRSDRVSRLGTVAVTSRFAVLWVARSKWELSRRHLDQLLHS